MTDHIYIRKTNFISLSNKKHNNKYDYSHIDYINYKTKIKIICPIHGIFFQLPSNHSKGIGCPKCKTFKQPTTTPVFIKQANKKHNNKYDYSYVNYIHSHQKIKIICNIHGEFWQTPTNHLSGKGCLQCSIEHKINNYSYTSKSTRHLWENIQGDFYVLSLESNNEFFYKIGVTNNLKRRLNEYPKKLYNTSLIFYTNDTLGNCFNKEQQTLKNMLPYSYTPQHKFNGYTECFNFTK